MASNSSLSSQIDGLGVVGEKDVKGALEAGQVDELLIAPPGQPLDAETIDALVTQARNTSATVTVIEDASLLSDVGGVGALLRYKVPGQRYAAAAR